MNNKNTRQPRRWLTNKELSPDVSDISLGEYQGLSNKSTARLQKDCYTISMVQDFLLASDGAGTIANVISDNPSTSSNWSAIASVFDEYRTLGFEVRFREFSYVNTTGGLVFAPIARVVDLDTVTALTGYTLSAQYSSYQESPGNRPWTTRALMSGVENSSYISTASPVARYYVKLYSTNNTASTNLGRLEIKWIVQFRGKGI